MLCPEIWVLKRTKSPGIETPPNSTKNQGSSRNPSIGGRTRSLGDQYQAQRCTKQLCMIPTNKSEPKHLRNEGISRARKTDENSSKKTRKSNELQTGNRRNHETEENSNPIEQGNEKQFEWMVCLKTLELTCMSPLRARQNTTLPLALKL
jgi:hypothetical protein